MGVEFLRDHGFLKISFTCGFIFSILLLHRVRSNQLFPRFLTATSGNMIPLLPLCNQLSVEVYPNPSSGEFTVYGLQFTVNSLNVYNVFGKLVFQTTVNSKQETVNLNLPSGMYFLKLISMNNEIVTAKILIEK